MRPLRLDMQAFGPYASSASVDFRGLINGGLFLIHGPTGAGKTSILDGICFALFGTSSGADRSGEGLRCDLAAPQTPTEVVFEFSLGSDLYRILRRPKQLLKKQRGEGLATQLPKGEIWKLGAGPPDHPAAWELVASGDKKCDERIAALLGMTEDQFRQVVVLPQGQFRKFLSATSDAREELLETLFRTAKYRRLAEHLSEKSIALDLDVKRKRQELAALLASFDADAADQLEAAIRESEAEMERLTESDEALEGRVAEAVEKLNRARTVRKMREDLDAFETRSKRLLERKPAIDELTASLERDRRARPVLEPDTAIVKLERDLHHIEKSRAVETERLADSEASLVNAREQKAILETRASEIEMLRGEQQRLRELWQTAKRLKSEQETVAARETDLHAAIARAESLEEKLTEARRSRADVAARLQTGQQAAVRAEALHLERKHRISDRDTVENELREIDQLLFQIGRAAEFTDETQKSWEDERRRLASLRIGFHLSQAAILARELKHDEPCPVCGGREHPAPAVHSAPGTTPSPTPEEIETAELALQRVSDRLVTAKTRSDGFNQELAKAKARLSRRFGADADVISLARTAAAQAERDLARLEKQIETVEAAATEHALLANKVSGLEAEVAKLETEAREMTARLSDSRLGIETSRARVTELLAQVPPESRELEKIGARGQVIARELESYARELESATKTLEHALQVSAAARAKIAALSDEISRKQSARTGLADERAGLFAVSGFASLEECRAARLTDDMLAKNESARRAFNEERAIVESRLEELRAELVGAPEWAFDFAARENEHREADTARTNARGRVLALKDRQHRLTIAAEKTRRLATEIGALEERFKVVGRLAGVATGHPTYNLSRVNFPRYVLAARLDDVLELASRRLAVMSRGQFTLRRAITQDDKRRNAGLDLEVEDGFTGSRRPTASLSGGEGFMASLCLALGLAEVVQSELGGIRLEAVFIDEGFGTLDSETLELAMKVLTELQAGGRIVGVISHVPELRDQIARRLHVRKSPQGSDVRWESASI